LAAIGKHLVDIGKGVLFLNEVFNSQDGMYYFIRYLSLSL